MTQAALPHAIEGTEAPADIALRHRARARRRTVLQALLGFGLPAVLLLAWEIAAALGRIDSRFFPPPSRIATAAAKYLATADGRDLLLFHLLATLYRLAVGYVIGAVLGVIVGVVMGLTAAVRWALTPLIFGLFPLPKIAIYPLVIIVFGLGDVSSIALVALGVFFMTCINTLSGVSHMNAMYLDVAAVFRFPPLTRWLRVVLPAAMPAVVTGLRLGLGQALILVVSSEFVSADSGIGRFIWDSWQVLDIPRMFIGLATVLLLGAASALGGDMLERKFVPWKRQ